MRVYVILTEEQAEDIDFSLVMEGSADTLRWSLDGEKTFVKFSNSDPTPAFLDGIAQFTNAEMLDIIATDEWTIQEPPG